VFLNGLDGSEVKEERLCPPFEEENDPKSGDSFTFNILGGFVTLSVIIVKKT